MGLFGGNTLFDSSEKSGLGLFGGNTSEMDITIVRRSSDQSISNGTNTNITWNSVVFQTSKATFNGNETNIRIKRDGLYLIEMAVEFYGDVTPSGIRSAFINGTSQIKLIDNRTEDDPLATNNSYLHGFTVAYLREGTSFNVRVWQTSGGSLSVRAAGYTQLSVIQLTEGR